MPWTLKRNAIAVTVLAAFFDWAFMFAKHDPALRPVIPFGEDPYDAVGSFGVIAGTLIALISLFRAFRPYRPSASSEQRLYLLRSQVAVVLTVVITLAADAVAMTRHPTLWIASPARTKLIALLAALAIVAAAALLLLFATREKSTISTAQHRWQAAGGFVLAMLVLAVYPEELIRGTATHLLTVIAGDLILFAPMRPLLFALVPGEEFSTAKSSRRSRWIAVLLLGVLIGAFIFIGEMTEGSGTLPLLRVLFVAFVFIGLAVAGLLIAYAFLGKPLGFAPRAIRS